VLRKNGAEKSNFNANDTPTIPQVRARPTPRQDVFSDAPRHPLARGASIGALAQMCAVLVTLATGAVEEDTLRGGRAQSLHAQERDVVILRPLRAETAHLGDDRGA